MIIITGGDGFIGKNLYDRLVEIYDNEYVISLDIKSLSYVSIMKYLDLIKNDIDFIFHLGAITDTGLQDVELFDKYNLGFSKTIWNICVENNIPLIYASSAATYGDGSYGFNDDLDPYILKPLNPYGKSKNNFDFYVKNSINKPPFWTGLKFFNVYGHDERHKNEMASVVYHFYNQIIKNNSVKLFKSYRDDVLNGEQKRDFIYVDDIINVCIYLYKNHKKINSDIYNVGTGNARSYNDLAKIVFKNLGIIENITYIDIPDNIRNSYQYYTEANIEKIRNVGYDLEFISLEEGIFKYLNKLKYENR